MADNSNFVLRWEIENTSSFTGDKAESAVFNEGGFQWKMDLQTNIPGPENFNFTLNCDHQRATQWKCKIYYQLFIHASSTISHKGRYDFNEDDNDFVYYGFISRGSVRRSNADRCIVECRINILSLDCDVVAPILDLSKFASTTEMGNVTLVIGDEKLQVSKEFLSLHSSVLSAMFLGNFAEKGEEEVEIKDVDYKEFINLLHVIYPGRVTITDSTVLHILALGDQFQMEHAIILAETHIRDSKKFSTAEKLRIADQYKLAVLRNHCLKTYSTVHEIAALELTPAYSNFSDKMKAQICDRMMKLVNEAK